ncbi:hypothetical protein ILYODFUR_038546 [Ilyodon furcidens]|uniref:Uncharacterized protein n=1 Tax=Ilyodon furcidens TaxID=33524 RepID=A0ABV0V9L5_9TELE
MCDSFNEMQTIKLPQQLPLRSYCGNIVCVCIITSVGNKMYNLCWYETLCALQNSYCTNFALSVMKQKNTENCRDVKRLTGRVKREKINWQSEKINWPFSYQ